MASETQSQRRPGQFIRVLFFVVAAVIAGFFGGRYLERTTVESPQKELEIALLAFRAGDNQAALFVLKPLADQGNPKAQYWLADMYENGLGVNQDFLAARGLLEKSATLGFVPAERRLGELYLRGTETLQDFGKAQTWLRRAATAGDDVAQRQLGQIFALGMGVPRDLPEAYGWYENAALSGDGIAKNLRDDLVTRMPPEEIARGEEMAQDIKKQIKPAKP